MLSRVILPGFELANDMLLSLKISAVFVDESSSSKGGENGGNQKTDPPSCLGILVFRMAAAAIIARVLRPSPATARPLPYEAHTNWRRELISPITIPPGKREPAYLSGGFSSVNSRYTSSDGSGGELISTLLSSGCG
ncbi:hypothetical protein AVEN_133393-1 [Araneus ventricosus]|uniref:Uncharacterized protein n=1 Tax=Araneus ventricosus TaxID=182803 RepID=A0A4Y2PPP2_ARAVE|nr:hypothetical protein AVEN_133393-1 [Araneus ventricosus]